MSRKALAPAIVTIVILAIVVTTVMLPLALTTQDPVGVLETFVFGPFRNLRYLGNIVEIATPTMLWGLAVALMLRWGMFNLGVEGAFYLGGLGTVAAALLLPMPWWAAAPVALAAGAVVGSTVCVLPGVMRDILLADPAWVALERTLTRDDLLRAEAIVVCNALRGPMPAVRE